MLLVGLLCCWPTPTAGSPAGLEEHYNVVHDQPITHHPPRRGVGARVDVACAETGRSRGDIVRDALRRQLQLMRFERLRRQALPFGEAAGWLTDDDVFASVS